MKRAICGLLLLYLGCTSRAVVKDSADEKPETPGGTCFWSVREGGAECEVETAIESRRRIAGTFDDIRGVEGYGKKKWKCGEKREVCGTEVECTCPFPVTAPDGGS